LLDCEQDLKLIDFGLCARPKGGMANQLQTCCGSPAYAAPELVSGKPYIGSEADMWSMGVLLYALLNGFLPFDDDNLAILYRKIRTGKYLIKEHLSQSSVHLISRLLQVDPKKRITMQELKNSMWIQKDVGLPVDSNSDHQSLSVFDNDVIIELSVNCKVSLDTMKKELSKVNVFIYSSSF